MTTPLVATDRVGLPSLGFGGAPIGNLYRAVDDAVATAAIEAAWEEGVRYFDTAPHYGLGLSERRLGQALQHHPRDLWLVSTKVGRLLEPNPHRTGSDLEVGGFAVADDLCRVRDYSRDGVLRSVEASLRRLNTDYLDVVYVHDPEDHMDTAISASLPTLAELRGQGVVRAVGAGMNHVEPLRRIVGESDVDVVMVAGRWTLLDRTAIDLLDDCAARDIRVVAAAPFNSGLLSRYWPRDDATYDYAQVTAAALERARTMATVCRAFDVSLPHAALQFPLSHAAVSTVVVGLANPDEAHDAGFWMRSELPAGLWPRLNEV